ncbi:MAG: flagellar protein FliS [Mariniblastus sp.]|jgi:flagellar protein FliS
MSEYQAYSIESTVNGWTRIDMLLALYDRAIEAIKNTKIGHEIDDQTLYSTSLLDANKYIFGLHSGLNIEKDPVAENVARLLSFVMLRLEEKQYDESVHFLEKLRDSFNQIRDEATELEKAGKIPPLNSEPGFNTVA